MAWKRSKTIPSLITHYGRWTKQDENDFYNSVSFENWRGSFGLIPRSPSMIPSKLENFTGIKKSLDKKKRR